MKDGYGPADEVGAMKSTRLRGNETVLAAAEVRFYTKNLRMKCKRCKRRTRHEVVMAGNRIVKSTCSGCGK